MDNETRKALEQIAMEESLVLAERGGLDFRGINNDITEVSIMTLRIEEMNALSSETLAELMKEAETIMEGWNLGYDRADDADE